MLDVHMQWTHIRVMTLDDYLTENAISEAAFGKAIGLSQSQVNRIRYGDSWPPKGVMERIDKETGRRVTPNDFLTPVARKTRPAEQPAGEAA